MPIGVNPDPYSPSGSSSTSTDSTSYENRRIGVNLLGQEPQSTDTGLEDRKSTRLNSSHT